jgi:hypothetical protein
MGRAGIFFCQARRSALGFIDALPVDRWQTFS